MVTNTWEARGTELITGTCLEMRGMCKMMCICGNVRGERANVLGCKGMTLQGGPLLPHSPLLKDSRKDI